MAGLAAACSGPDDSAAPTRAQLTALLTGLGRAVRQHDRAAYLAGIDPAAAANGFRVAQGSALDNLRHVPLSAWSYRLGPEVTQRDVLHTAQRRFGPSARIYRIELAYSLGGGFDRTLSRHDLWWTFARHDGRVVVAADDALDRDGGVSWQGPWDFGPMAVVRGRASLVLGEADEVPTLREVAAGLDRAVPVVTRVWGTGWTRRVVAFVPGTSAALQTALGGVAVPHQGSATEGDVAALTVFDGDGAQSATTPGSTALGAPTGDARVIVVPSVFAGLSTLGRQITLTHEVTHVASAAATTQASPRWLVEGLAEYAANLDTGQPVAVAASELAADVRAGHVPTGLPAAATFDAASSAPAAYEQAWLACRLIASRVGTTGLDRFYRLAGADPLASATTSAGLRRAFADVLHESAARFVAQWRSYLSRELR